MFHSAWTSFGGARHQDFTVFSVFNFLTVFRRFTVFSIFTARAVFARFSIFSRRVRIRGPVPSVARGWADKDVGPIHHAAIARPAQARVNRRDVATTLQHCRTGPARRMERLRACRGRADAFSALGSSVRIQEAYSSGAAPTRCPGPSPGPASFSPHRIYR